MNDQITRAVLARQPEYPPEQSMGGINTYTVSCRVVGYTPGYCVCLHKIAAFERDGELKSYAECDKGIRSGDCPALGLRAEERKAGKALYFVDRNLLREEMDKYFADQNASFRPARATPVKPSIPLDSGIVKKNTQPAKPAPSATVKSSIEDDGYAAAINAAIRETQAAQKPEESMPQAPVQSVEPSTKGMSLLELARLHLNKTQ